METCFARNSCCNSLRRYNGIYYEGVMNGRRIPGNTVTHIFPWKCVRLVVVVVVVKNDESFRVCQ